MCTHYVLVYSQGFDCLLIILQYFNKMSDRNFENIVHRGVIEEGKEDRPLLKTFLDSE